MKKSAENEKKCLRMDIAVFRKTYADEKKLTQMKKKWRK